MERARTEAALSEREEHQRFLLRFSDALRTDPDADAIAHRAVGLLAEHMSLDRCYITLYRVADDRADFPYQVGNDKCPLCRRRSACRISPMPSSRSSTGPS